LAELPLLELGPGTAAALSGSMETSISVSPIVCSLRLALSSSGALFSVRPLQEEQSSSLHFLWFYFLSEGMETLYFLLSMRTKNLLLLLPSLGFGVLGFRV
jgi:hypothetical protein